MIEGPDHLFIDPADDKKEELLSELTVCTAEFKDSVI